MRMCRRQGLAPSLIGFFFGFSWKPSLVSFVFRYPKSAVKTWLSRKNLHYWDVKICCRSIESGGPTPETCISLVSVHSCVGFQLLLIMRPETQLLLNSVFWLSESPFEELSFSVRYPSFFPIKAFAVRLSAHQSFASW